MDAPLASPRVAIGFADKHQGAEEPERETSSMAAIRILATTLCLLASGAAFADDRLPRAKPEDVGLSSERPTDRKSTRLNSSHANISYAVFCLKKKKNVTTDWSNCR